jgi:hypothetical protein
VPSDRIPVGDASQSGPEAHSSAEDAVPARAGDMPPVSTPHPQPVRDLTLQLTSDSQRVDVKLVDRGGEVHVAVRSVDPMLTTDLRASVHDLIGSLEKSGFRAETWQPGETPQRNSDIPNNASRGAGDTPQSQAGTDPRQQGRNLYDPDIIAARRSRGPNADWLQQMGALTGAEKEN